MSKKWWLLLLVLVLVIAAGAAVALRSRGAGPEAIEVELEPVSRTRIVQTVTATGRIQPKTQVKISADVSAKITRLEVEEGDWIEKGTFLLELDRGRYLAASESSEANLRVAQSNANVTKENLTKAGKDLERTRELHRAGLETDAQLDAGEAAFEAQKARHAATIDQVEQARAVLKQTRDDLAKTRIYAPMAGTVSEVNKEVGEIALGSQFQEDVILVISNLSGMEAEVRVDENDVVLVTLGDEATVEADALPDTVLDGDVTEIANTASLAGGGTTDQKTEFDVTISIREAASSLRTGMTTTAEIVTDVRENGLAVPIQAVAVRTIEQLEAGADDDSGALKSEWNADKDGFVEIVFVVADGRAEARQVGTGIQSDTHIEIVEGLSEGERIVVGSYRAISRDLEHGSSVQETDSSDSGASGGGAG